MEGIIIFFFLLSMVIIMMPFIEKINYHFDNDSFLKGSMWFVMCLIGICGLVLTSSYMIGGELKSKEKPKYELIQGPVYRKIK